VSSHKTDYAFQLVITIFELLTLFFFFVQFLILWTQFKHFIYIETKGNTNRKIEVFHVSDLITEPIYIEH